MKYILSAILIIILSMNANGQKSDTLKKYDPALQLWKATGTLTYTHTFKAFDSTGQSFEWKEYSDTIYIDTSRIRKIIYIKFPKFVNQ